MLEGQEAKPCLRCEDGSTRSGGYVELMVQPEPEGATEAGVGVVYRVEECLVCGATELGRWRDSLGR